MEQEEEKMDIEDEGGPEKDAKKKKKSKPKKKKYQSKGSFKFCQKSVMLTYPRIDKTGITKESLGKFLKDNFGCSVVVVCIEVKQLTFFSENHDTELPEITLIETENPKVNNWIDTIFRITETTYNTRLICLQENNLTINDIDVYIEGKLAPVKFNGASFDPQLTYHFNKTGIYNIKFNVKKKLTTMNGFLPTIMIY